MSRSTRPRIALYVYGGSIVLHAALAVGAVLMPKPKRVETVAIELAEAKKKKEPPKPPPAPPPPPPEAKPKPRVAAAPPQAQAKVAEAAKSEAPPPAETVGNDGFADLGIALGNAAGPGLAVPAAAAAAAAAAPTAAATATHKVQQLAAAQGDACTEAVVPPKLKIPVTPKYTMEARQAEIEGVVRVEVTVDETGRVVVARVLSGLGYGLDESAVAAAKQLVFDPATRCGKPVVGTKKIPFRFQET